MVKISDSNSISDSISRHPLLLKDQSESIRETAQLKDKLQPSSTIVFSLANTMMGPTLLLLPLSVVNVGLLTSTIVAIILCAVSYKTCNLTHLHANPDEFEYISAIDRILGKTWKYVYVLFSIIILWMAGIIYFLSLCDVIYSAIQLIFDVTLVAESTISFKSFSYQYVGIIIMGSICWLFFLPRLGRILDLTEKGIYSIAVETIFLIYLGIKTMASGHASFVFYKDPPDETSIGATTSASLSYTIGVYAMAFVIHNAVVAIVRKNKNQANNSRDVGYAYIITLFFYIITGIFGAIGLYSKSGLQLNTVLSDSLYDRNDMPTFVFAIISQLMSAFQLITVLPVLNNIIRTQVFIMIWGEDGFPPKFALVIFNIVFILTFLIVQLLDISPNTVMSYAGAFVGFVIVYLVPIYIHLKSVRKKQVNSEERKSYFEMKAEGKFENVAEFLLKKKRMNYNLEYGVHIVIMGVGVYIFISQLIDLFK